MNTRHISPRHSSRNRSRRVKTTVRGFIIGLLLLNILRWLTRVESSFDLPKILKYVLSLTVLVLILKYRFKFRRTFANHPVRPVLVWFFIYSLFLVVCSIRPQVFYMQEFFASRYYVIPYLLPLILLTSTFRPFFFEEVLLTSRWMLFPGLLVQLALVAKGSGYEDWYSLAPAVLMFDVFSLLLLLVSHLYRSKVVFFSALAYHLALIYLAGSYGRRGVFLLGGLGLLAMVWLRLRNRSRGRSKKFAILIGLLAFVCVCSIFETSWTQLRVFERGFNQEGLEKSRGQVFEDFFSDFKGTSDYLFGRGLNGRIKRTIRGEDFGRNIENGYLSILFRAGLLYLVPFVMIMLYSAYLGYFKSNNDLSKALALIVSMHLVQMMAFGLPDFATPYILVWVAIASGFDRGLRMLNNSDLLLDTRSHTRQLRW